MKRKYYLRHLISPGFNRNYRARKEVIRHFLTQPHTTLDVGCGDSGYWSIASARRGGKVFAIDVNHEYIRRMRATLEDLGLLEKIETAVMNLFELPPEKTGYDQIICMEVLEHIRDDRSAIQLLAKRLNRDGFLHITTPNIEKDAWWEATLDWHENGGHVRHGYSFASLERLLNKAGLEVVAQYRIGGWGTSTAFGMDTLFFSLLRKVHIPISICGVLCFLLFSPLEWLGNLFVRNDPGMSIYVIARHRFSKGPESHL